MTTLDRAELRLGPRLHIQNGERKSLDLLEDGTLTAVGAFEGFLGIGRWNFSETPLVNGLAVVEFTYEFVSFYERLLRDYIEPLPPAVRFAVRVRNAHFNDRNGEVKRLLLRPGRVGDFYGIERWAEKAAPETWFDGGFDADTFNGEPRLDVGRIAFAILRRLFNFFGHADEAVPYRTPDGDAIDMEEIANG